MNDKDELTFLDDRGGEISFSKRLDGNGLHIETMTKYCVGADLTDVWRLNTEQLDSLIEFLCRLKNTVNGES